MSQQSTGLSDLERIGGPKGGNPISARGPPPATDFALDHIHLMRDFCVMLDVDRSTLHRWEKAGKGPAITRLSPRLSGIRHRDYLDWLESLKQHNTEAA